MTGCESCDRTCQYCDGCQSCNSCEACDEECDGGGCDMAQNFCSDENGGQSAGGFSFGRIITGNSLFFTHNEWNSLITYINNAYAKGSASLTNNAQSGNGVSESGIGGDSELPESDTNEFMTASMYNAVSAALHNLGSETTQRTVVANVDVVYGSYFTELENYADNLLYKTTQCDDCNVACNIKCNTCLTCNEENCGSCDEGCQSDAVENCCSSCDECECSAEGGEEADEDEDEDED